MLFDWIMGYQLDCKATAIGPDCTSFTHFPLVTSDYSCSKAKTKEEWRKGSEEEKEGTLALLIDPITVETTDPMIEDVFLHLSSDQGILWHGSHGNGLFAIDLAMKAWIQRRQASTSQIWQKWAQIWWCQAPDVDATITNSTHASATKNFFTMNPITMVISTMTTATTLHGPQASFLFRVKDCLINIMNFPFSFVCLMSKKKG